ncbi:MAG: CopL family metal-binding regulatory protein [Pedobacter sp.]|nr:CopL family metal-binding regulatory protein [Pedobacter sp.]
MSSSLLFRCFLLLALLLNGLAAAHAAVKLPPEPVQKAEAEAAVAHEDCHDMAMQGHEAGAEDMSPAPDQSGHQHADCCKGGVCQCVCATQASSAETNLLLSPVPSSHLQASLPTAYRSVDLALILRPPIA